MITKSQCLTTPLFFEKWTLPWNLTLGITTVQNVEIAPPMLIMLREKTGYLHFLYHYAIKTYGTKSGFELLASVMNERTDSPRRVGSPLIFHAVNWTLDSLIIRIKSFHPKRSRLIFRITKGCAWNKSVSIIIKSSICTFRQLILVKDGYILLIGEGR